MQITDYIQQIGAYAGFAAVIGLAVLAALYFSQAREVRRLREEGVPEAGTGAPPPPGQAAQRLQTQRPAAAAAATAATAVQAPLAPGQKPPVQPPPPSTQVPAPGAQTPAARPPAPVATRPPVRPPARQPAGPQRARAPQSKPWYQSLEPRFLVLLVAGIVIVGGALIVGISSLGGSSGPRDVPFGVVTEGSDTTKPDKSATGSTPTGTAPVDPAQITVAVLNGTSVPGLAASIGDTVKAAGFKLGNIDNAPTQAANESAVLYAAGNEPAAQAVAKELDIAQVGQIDAGTQSQAGNAQVVVVVGPDQAP